MLQATPCDLCRRSEFSLLKARGRRHSLEVASQCHCGKGRFSVLRSAVCFGLAVGQTKRTENLHKDLNSSSEGIGLSVKIILLSIYL